MESVPISHGTMVKVLCCVCGTPVDPNPSNMCASCLAAGSDVSKGISTEGTLHQCRGCQRWHKDANKWIACELESRELMALCLQNVAGLKSKGQQVRLVDAGWIWTEPHSMRLKIRLTVQKEVQTGTILQQSFTVVFVVRNQQCLECQAEFRQGAWKAVVQVRQRVGHKRTFLYLEQLILKHGAHRGCLSIETFRDGMDFYFPDRGKGNRFISFLESVVPIKVKQSKKLIGTDDKSNISNYKYTYLVDMCTLCKDDLVYLPAKLARTLGNISRAVLVKNVSNLIHLIDPLTAQTASMSADQFWRYPIRPVITAARARLTRYVVLGKEAVVTDFNGSKKEATRKNKNRLATVTLAKESDLGINDKQFNERSHLGYLARAGDICLAYDLTETQFVDDEAEEVRVGGKLPDVIVVRKLYGGAATGDVNAAKQRIWQLQRLDVEVAEDLKASKAKKNAEMDDMDEEDFLREVEADAEMRRNMNLYKSEIGKKKADGDLKDDDDEDDEDEDDQKVKLDELLDGLVLNDGPDAEDADPRAEEDELDEEEGFMGTFNEGERAAKDGITYVGRDRYRDIRDKETAVPVASNVFGAEYLKDKTQFKFT